MDRLEIIGGHRLEGRVAIAGAKNAALPLMAAALLTDEPVQLTNVPALADIRSMAGLLKAVGVEIAHDEKAGRLRLVARDIACRHAPYDLVRKMRASILVLGPLLARTGQARVALPGGCAIGPRPIDLHLKGLEALGAEISLEEGDVIARAPRGLQAARIVLPKVSVGATENLMMAAALARGTTVIENAAREPEVVDLGQALIGMGAEIAGLGSDCITITGRERLAGTTHAVIADRIEAGSYAIAAAITGGNLLLAGAEPHTMDAVIAFLRAAGVEVVEQADGLRVSRDPATPLKPVNVVTQPYPGFPTDMQAQAMALMSLAEGACVITEAIFENRFMHVLELVRLGADITVTGASAVVRGVDRLVGAPVMATDLRASMSLVLAGLAAEGRTIVNRVYHLDRGYTRIEGKLGAVGARIRRLKD
ncbi:MAG: UDP-N-acetylglucosamine 1-carboxyvinyltransferase [Alphaproteobacteria bacterium]|nr:MAG: UDP-N-acetylglucosamine 1-carboxyvinyltransferase [Alphaproteobacteria bacterium]